MAFWIYSMKTERKALSIASIGAFFYFYQFFVRNSPGVIVEFLVRDFGISATMLGWFSAAYYWTYAPSQIPMGILLDNWGPRRVLLMGSSLCVAGIFLLSSASAFWIAFVARLLIGIGASTAFIGQARMSTLWFSPKKVALVIGFVSAMGVIGGTFSSIALPYMLFAFPSWKTAFFFLGCAGLLVIFCIWKFMDNGASFIPAADRMSFDSIKGQVLTVLRSRVIWLAGIYGYATYLSISVFSDTWSPLFLKSMYGFSIQKASSLKAFVLIGSCVGCPVFAKVSDMMKKRIPCLRFCVWSTFVVTASIMFIPFNSEITLSIMLFLLGFLSSGEILIFPIAVESMPHRLSGTSTAVINMFTMLGGMLHTPLIGWILDSYNKASDTYPVFAYQVAFSTILIATVIAGILTFFIPETFPKDE